MAENHHLYQVKAARGGGGRGQMVGRGAGQGGRARPAGEPTAVGGVCMLLEQNNCHTPDPPTCCTSFPLHLTSPHYTASPVHLRGCGRHPLTLHPKDRVAAPHTSAIVAFYTENKGGERKCVRPVFTVRSFLACEGEVRCAGVVVLPGPGVSVTVGRCVRPC